jgi:hypothetical protein
MFSLNGSQARNNKYFRKPLYNLNESFLKKLNRDYQKQGMDVSRWENDDTVLREEKMTTLVEAFPLIGFKVYLGSNYFHPVYDKLKLTHKSVLDTDWLEDSTGHEMYNTNIRMFSPPYWVGQIKRWLKTEVGFRNLYKLSKGVASFRYGIYRKWWDENWDPSYLEAALLFSPTLSSKSLSPHFFFSRDRHPKISKQPHKGEFVFQEIEPIIITWFALYEETPSRFLINFFTSLKQTPQDYYFKNRVLKILKKKSTIYLPLTLEEKSLGLRLYGLDRESYSIAREKRAPLLFHIEREFSSTGSRTKKIFYKKIVIIFDWKDFTVSIKGPVKKLKTLFLIGSLYHAFNIDFPDVRKELIYDHTKSTFSTISFNYSKQLKGGVEYSKKKHLQFNEVFWDDITSERLGDLVELKVELLPNVLLTVSQMFLTTNDKAVGKSDFFLREFLPSWTLIELWENGRFGESDFYDSWRLHK